eukprot:gnl/TRDRNA2_/TRDRNA2_164888_c1_seq2.p1 gnl/TRDRNA2_/TRDRNA2_164888_c1~~gnl/TRDRNA2_/TRDRNA2_164888_c1_seq2.p1  ORF type:complete len:452 (+),score=50.34 gnl/TRDRNA2_/TRDRNA2_164888_c1_seq2:70-1356(+)
MSKAEPEKVKKFKHLMVRLFSLMHACAITELSKDGSDDHARKAFSLELVDIRGLDSASLAAIASVDCKVELIIHWIQCLVFENISSGVIAAPPPIVGRAFQELSNGLVKLHDALKLSHLPFPFPYSQLTIWLLVAHMMLTPFVVCRWTNYVPLAGFLSFVMIVMLWSLYVFANQLENPFGSDDNDLDISVMQKQINKRLAMLVQPGAYVMPTLSEHADLSFKLVHLDKLRTESAERLVHEDLPDHVMSKVKGLFGLAADAGGVVHDEGEMKGDDGQFHTELTQELRYLGCHAQDESCEGKAGEQGESQGDALVDLEASVQHERTLSRNAMHNAAPWGLWEALPIPKLIESPAKQCSTELRSSGVSMELPTPVSVVDAASSGAFLPASSSSNILKQHYWIGDNIGNGDHIAVDLAHCKPESIRPSDTHG